MPTIVKKTGKRRPLKAATNAAAKKHAKPQLKTSPARIAKIIAGLQKAYPGATCALVHSTPWELLVETILSAQCTDARVNMVTPVVFRRFPTPAAMAKASLPEIEEIIRTTGFYHNKAKSISGAAKAVVERFEGEVPRTMEELLTVPGAARKTANVVLGTAYGIAVGIVVDTHVLRLTRRLELTLNTEPKKIEGDVM